MLVNFLATIRSFHGFTAPHPKTGELVRMRTFELRSKDPECKMRTISAPLENCADLVVGQTLRVSVEVVD